jgi:acyl-coenzyme A synthetase/AMP-(fatty) acid ligase/acyl carrier protein
MVKEVQEITKAWLPESLRLVIIGGEQVLAEAIMMWYEQVKNKSQLVNTYGPTETTVVVSSQYLIDSNTENPKTVSSSIGRPWANTIMYILDKKLNPVPLGVPGELYIGGAGLARGYLNRPDLTQEKFIPNPFSNNPKCRLYKTGDLCRYLSNGNIEYLGRIDAQINLRGFRIELGEIESVLVQEQEVRDAVVLVREDVLGEPRIIAYLVGQESEANTIRQKLKTKLPDYMIPSNFVWLSALPLTPNDKVDRKALAALGKDSYATKKVFREPRNSLEQQILDIWMSILHIERISIDDNFFELGGHSLLATQIISRIHQSFDIVIPLKTLFESPTVAELSLKVENLTNQNSRSMGSKIQRASRTLKRL